MSSLYLNRVQDFVTINNQPKMNMVAGIMNSFARSYQNVDARLYGGDLEAGYGLTQRLFLSGNVSYVRGAQDPDPAHRIYSMNLPEIPPIRGQAGLRYATRRISAEIEGVFTGAQNRVNTDLRESPTPGYGVANLKFSTTFRRFAIRAAWNNLFNRYYYEYLSYQRDPFRNGARVYEPGRNIYVNFAYRF
jgi:iron complex outermembrane recepter protein